MRQRKAERNGAQCASGSGTRGCRPQTGEIKDRVSGGCGWRTPLGEKDRGWQGADPGRRDDSEKLEEQMELRRDTLKEKREELEEQQEILQWEHHEKAKEKISLEEYEERDEIAEHLQIWKTS